ncbi:histidine kinase dimerization/phospho-acceptor domain-containing protein [Dongia sp.]|uniref:histidine kinase dimerization/phospho-acceptor domain-containing protein n=1 Tax=Dongia sp. TaxID=1977262 RepID=UPI0035B3E0AD
MNRATSARTDLTAATGDKIGAAQPRPASWQILIVDDDPDVHLTTEFALANETVLDRPLHFLHAYSAAEAEALLAKPNDIAVILLDVVMETEDAGLRLARTIRDKLCLSAPRIILRTGHPGYAPEHDVIRDYDIDDYRTKSELSRIRLFTSVTTALRAFDRLQQLLETNHRLEQITRDLEVLNIDYLEQREAALSAARAKSRFLNNVSHELRTPLNAIVGFSELSLRAIKDQRPIPPGYLEDILEAGRRLTSLVDDILDFSQLDARKRQLLVEPVNIQELIDYQEELFHGEATRLGLTISIVPGDRNHVSSIDRSSLSKVLGHIISNALRYSPRGETIEVSWRIEGGTIGIFVDDHGPGVPKSVKNNLDEPFSIGQEVLTKDASGLGLGLTICRHLMNMMGGRIAILDRAGGGTQVRLLLPEQAV